MAKPASSPSSGIAALARRRRPVHGRQVKLLPSLRSGSCQDNAVQNSCVVTAGCDQHEAVVEAVAAVKRYFEGEETDFPALSSTLAGRTLSSSKSMLRCGGSDGAARRAM